MTTTNGRLSLLQFTQSISAVRALAEMPQSKRDLWYEALQLKPIKPDDNPLPTLQLHGVLWDDVTSAPDTALWATYWLNNARDQLHSCFLYLYAGNYYTTAFPFNGYDYFVAALTAVETPDRPILREPAELACIIYGSRMFHVNNTLHSGEDAVIDYMKANDLYGGDTNG